MTVLPTIPSPTRADIYDERIEDCQVAVKEAFDALVAHGMAAGWLEDDVAIALTEVAHNHLLAIGYKPSA